MFLFWKTILRSIRYGN